MKLGTLVATAALTSALAVSLSDAPAVSPSNAADRGGERLYDIYCSNCHGAEGRGDGPTAEILTIPPTDLTRLTRPGAAFPLERVSRVIDGRQTVRGHGATGMPIWGLEFRQLNSDTDQEREVRERIGKLADYIRSIQRSDKSPGSE